MLALHSVQAKQAILRGYIVRCYDKKEIKDVRVEGLEKDKRVWFKISVTAISCFILNKVRTLRNSWPSFFSVFSHIKFIWILMTVFNAEGKSILDVIEERPLKARHDEADIENLIV